MPTRALAVVVLLVTLVLAGVVSRWASDSPDGLERVAEDTGFAQRAEEHPGADGPLADYRLGDSGGSAVPGIVGAVVVLVLASGTVYLVRRCGRQGEPQDTSRTADHT